MPGGAGIMRALSDKELQLILCVCLLSLLPVCLTDWNRWARMGAGVRRKLLSGLVYGYCGVCIVWNLWCMTAYWYRVLPTDEADWDTIRAIVGMIR